MSSESDIIGTNWDAVVVGAGMGGATLGYRLAAQGWRVLFCESGRFHLDDPEAQRGDFAEMFFPSAAVPDGRHRESLLAAGRWPHFVEDRSDAKPRRYIPFLGSGSGGSSALYGAAMERFSPEDFLSPIQSAAAASAGTQPAWPVDYPELEPYYAEAERLFRVRGGRDPLTPDGFPRTLLEAPPLSPASRELFDLFQSKGLHPYRLPIACDFKPGCQPCQGFLCNRNCKSDSSSVCLRPALQEHGARYLDRCHVVSLEANRHRVRGIVCEREGRRFTLRGSVVVLAAGALMTPLILLRSTSGSWPQGLANDSGQVGRNLMRHCIDLYAVKTQKRSRSEEGLKEIAFNDFYFSKGQRLGTVQSFGRLPPAAMLVEVMQQEIREGFIPPLGPLFGPLKPMFRHVLSRTLCEWPVLATTLEDPPVSENRVFPIGESGIGLFYRLGKGTEQRIRDFRRLMAETLHPKRYKLIKQAENNERIAHACGTCRMGKDPSTSVVDPWNRAHRLENLYIVDSSFFPTSGGTNPALTIAANALRVAAHMVKSEGAVPPGDDFAKD
jgi:choline dehydrogenase-like flavoprotein